MYVVGDEYVVVVVVVCMADAVAVVVEDDVVVDVVVVGDGSDVDVAGVVVICGEVVVFGVGCGGGVFILGVVFVRRLKPRMGGVFS